MKDRSQNRYFFRILIELLMSTSMLMIWVSCSCQIGFTDQWLSALSIGVRLFGLSLLAYLDGETPICQLYLCCMTSLAHGVGVNYSGATSCK